MSIDTDPENMIAKAKKNLIPNRVDMMNDSKPMFPVLSKKDEPSPLFPSLTEMAGLKPLLPDNMGMLRELRRRNIPAYTDNEEITGNRLFSYKNQMDTTIDIINRLRRFRPL
jgi:hypothetical protein